MRIVPLVTPSLKSLEKTFGWVSMELSIPSPSVSHIFWIGLPEGGIPEYVPPQM